MGTKNYYAKINLLSYLSVFLFFILQNHLHSWLKWQMIDIVKTLHFDVKSR